MRLAHVVEAPRRPQRSAPAGIRVGGPTRRTRAPSSCSRRRWSGPPGCAARRRRWPPSGRRRSRRSRRMVRASSRAWVGCSWLAVAGVDHAAADLLRQQAAAPEAAWRTTSRSGFMAFRVTAVSIRVSPLVIDEVRGLMLTVSAPSRLAASSKTALGAGRGLEEQVDQGAPLSRVAASCRAGGSGRRRRRPGRAGPRPRAGSGRRRR